MTIARPLQRTRACQRGVSLITAVFLLVVLAGLLAAMARVVTTQQTSSSLDMLGNQAYQAARSGLEWGIYQQLRVRPPLVDCFPSPQTFAMPADASLRNFRVTVSCTVKVGGNTVGQTTNRWTIVAVACNAPGTGACPDPSSNAEYVARRVQAELN